MKWSDLVAGESPVWLWLDRDTRRVHACGDGFCPAPRHDGFVCCAVSEPAAQFLLVALTEVAGLDLGPLPESDGDADPVVLYVCRCGAGTYHPTGGRIAPLRVCENGGLEVPLCVTNAAGAAFILRALEAAGLRLRPGS